MIRKPCIFDADFQRSITFQRQVEVWKLDKVGKVEKYTKEYVVIDGGRYKREHCEFWIV
jgi:hypothetical protein